MSFRLSAPRPFGAFQEASYFPALDGLRAVSIFLVLLHHVPPFRPGLLSTLQENGRYGVSFFFVISGFLICTLFLREKEKTGRIDLLKFYGRRALRLLPLYYVTLALQAVLVFVLKQYTPENQELFRGKLPAYLFYYSNWLASATQGPFFCAWSLAVEEQFYLGFGLLLRFARHRLVIGLALAALFTKAAAHGLFGPLDTGSALWRVIFSYQESILLGVLLAFVLARRWWYDVCVRGLRSPWILPCLAAGLVAWLCAHAMRTQSSLDAQALYLLMTLIVAGVVIRPVTPGLCGAIMTHVGRISYGIYLLHMFVISLVKKLPGGTNPAVCLLLSTVAVIAVASVVYRYLELPIIRFYKNKLTPSRPASGQTADDRNGAESGVQFNGTLPSASSSKETTRISV